MATYIYKCPTCSATKREVKKYGDIVDKTDVLPKCGCGQGMYLVGVEG